MTIKPENFNDFLKNGCGRCAYGGTPDCKVHNWNTLLATLRATLIKTVLKEEIKWSVPCYTHKGKTVLSLSALKAKVVVSFFRGAELKDAARKLKKPGENSRFARYFEFNNNSKLETDIPLLLSFIEQAIQLPPEKPVVETPKLDLPEELLKTFKQYPDFKKAFYGLTPGRQRGYLLHYCSAKQSSTRLNRIEKSMDKIFQGKGWNER